MSRSRSPGAALASLLFVVVPSRALAQEPVLRYRVAPDFATSTWSVDAVVPVPAAGDLEFRFSRWTAGAYHLAEYGRFVERFEARAADGAALEVAREGDDRFVVRAAPAGTVTLSWSARECAPHDTNERMILDVEGNRISDRYGFVNPNSLLGCPKGAQDLPCELELVLPEGWSSAAGLARRDDGVYVAPSWWRLEDSPVLFASQLDSAVFEVDGIPHQVSLVGADAAKAKELAERCRRMAEAGRDLMQGLPYPRYAFLLGFVDESGGGAGLEHHDSTLILVGRNSGLDHELDHLIAHEYFHAWCAERIHVAALERPDYSQPLATGTIWVNEGITEYFCRHLLVRAGLLTREKFFDVMWESGAQARAMWPMLGDRSWTDVNRDAGGWDDFNDLIAFSIKNYLGGAWTVFGLDLAMRRASAGERGVADLLRFLDHAYARQGRGFGETEMPAICEGIAQADLDDYFARYVDGPELPDLKQLLSVIGYTTKGGLGKVVPVEQPTAEQQAALEDFFDLPRATAPPAR